MVWMGVKGNIFEPLHYLFACINVGSFIILHTSKQVRKLILHKWKMLMGRCHDSVCTQFPN